MHGVDFDLELTPGNNGPFHSGHMQAFCVAASSAARATALSKFKKKTFFRKKLPAMIFDFCFILPAGSIISHAPQAPYLGSWAGDDLGYTGILSRGELDVDFLNIQFYNQGAHETYHSLFIDHAQDHWLDNSSIGEMITNGVPTNKIVVGKYLRDDAGTYYASNGYVEPATLNQWTCSFKSNTSYTVAGFMVWMYAGPSDSSVLNWGKLVNKQCIDD